MFSFKQICSAVKSGIPNEMPQDPTSVFWEADSGQDLGWGVEGF